MPEAIYAGLCPVCNQDLDYDEVKNSECKNKKVKFYYREEDKEIEEFVNFFMKYIGKPKAIQKMWAKRVLRNESFAATAPTGIGKTSFGIIMSLFLALKGKRCYLIFPTSILVSQAIEVLNKYMEKEGILNSLRIGYYHSRMNKEEKEKFLQNLKKFEILITTTQFLSRHYKELGTFDFIFVDDVDAILKASKNVDKLLTLLGFHFNDKIKNWEGKAKGCLMVSTATAKKGKKVELFRKLLNFDIGLSTITVRNIEDVAINDESIEMIIEILNKLGVGGIIYARNSDEAEKIYNALKNFKIGYIGAKKNDDFEKFVNGELDYLIGTSYYYGKLVRGLDLPERIRFAIFVGCPSFRIKIEDLDSLSPQILKILAIMYRKIPEIEEILPKLEKEMLYDQLRKILKRVIHEYKADVKDIVIRENEIIFPDVRTYIQASGRTSRLFAGGLTKGASFLLEKDIELLSAFIEKAKYYDIDFKTLEEIDFNLLIKELNETREKYKKRAEYDVIKPALFIVESPTKAKQISHFFGKPSVKIIDGIVVYEVPMQKFILMVTASIGHVTDLITDKGLYGVITNGKFVPIYASIKKCKECEYQFTEESNNCPRCGSSNIDDSKRRIEAIRKLAHDTEFIIIGTDPDTEGEKIAWDFKNLLSGCGTIKRAEFHEVTKKAILEAIDSIRDIDENLVKAQIVRRIEDRWIGFTLSQKLWKKFNNRNLSAGRAQTPVLGWVIDRYKKSGEKKKIAIIEDFDLEIEYDKNEFDLKIELLEEKEEKMSLPPYTTDSLLRDANLFFKFSAKQIMQIAQELFENGLITYHRTDAIRVSEVGLKIAKDYLHDDFFGRTWGESGAHECIRPTRALDKDNLQRLIQEGVIIAEGLKWQHLALYDLIFRRFMASQCKPFLVKIKKYRIEINGKSIEEERFVDAKGRAYELYKAVYIRKELPIGKFHVKAKIRSISKAPLLTQSEIIKMMKEKGIGRPSTYATIVERLFMRNYVIEKNGKVIPTNLGFKVFNYLHKNYSKFVSEERTRYLEERMGAVEKGNFDYLKALQDIHEEIKELI